MAGVIAQAKYFSNEVVPGALKLARMIPLDQLENYSNAFATKKQNDKDELENSNKTD